MNREAMSVHGTGLVTAAGFTAAASCAAFRAKVTNPTETKFLDKAGGWIVAHQVLLDAPWRGVSKLAHMAAMAATDALQGVDRDAWDRIPALLCVAEPRRPGRTEGLDDRLPSLVRTALQSTFGPESAVIARGRVGFGVALVRARELLNAGRAERVIIIAVDSLLNWLSLSHYLGTSRLITPENSDGFMPGEGAGAVLLGRPRGLAELCIAGLGFGVEPAPIHSGEPLRGEGLAQAMRSAVADAQMGMQDIDFRIADLSGEHYYFKEAALALSRTLRNGRSEFDLWHPAEVTGEAGALAGAAITAAADAACRKGYASGHSILAHLSADDGERAAIVCRWHDGA